MLDLALAFCLVKLPLPRPGDLPVYAWTPPRWQGATILPGRALPNRDQLERSDFPLQFYSTS